MKKPVCSFVLLPALLLGSCAGTAKDQPVDTSANQSPRVPAAGLPLTIDNCGHQLALGKASTRAVSLNQSSIETQLSLGTTDKVVGTTTWTDPVSSSLENENAKAERISDDGPTSEAVIAKRPDFITTSFLSMLIDKVVGSYEKYESFGIPTCLASNQCGKKSGNDTPTENSTIEKVCQGINKLSRIHGVPERGKKFVA